MGQGPRRSTFARCVVVPLALVAWLAGCYKWGTVNGSPAEVLAESSDRVRLILTDGSGVTLDSAEVHADTVYGSEVVGANVIVQPRRAIPMADVAELQLRELDELRTNLLVIPAGIALGVILWQLVLCDDVWWEC